jgi:hypothetical protein
MGKEPVSAGSWRAGKNVMRHLFARCGRAWDKARFARRGWVGKKVAFLNILQAIRHYCHT